MGPFVNVFVASLLLLQGSAGMTLYEYYVPSGVVEAPLVAEGDTFTLNNKDILILSGAFHYFRVHPAYWRDTLRKLRAAGLNAVETYVPWNLHEPRQGVYDFGDLGESMSPFLDVRSFVQMAQEEDLFVILRPGPYICSEWDFGGMPSFLLRDHPMQVRTYYEGFR
ncbi:beta-galactosidase-1-like protein 2, partial [Homarus americanus]|uniref:beta-galactosidase-1-like protein 2 n=1 Tax=Homarus americanus TaxID=6706 RepID=UPI001C479655